MIKRTFFESKISEFKECSQFLKADLEIDLILGFDYQKNELSLKNKLKETYSDTPISSHALLTSYFDYYQILKSLPKNSTFVDIGSGYTRGNIVNQLCQFGHHCYGLELEQDRVEATKIIFSKLGIDHSTVRNYDILGNEDLPCADYYFLYLPTGSLLDHVMMKLSRLKHQYQLIVIESHGDLIDTLKSYDQWFK
jgi:hypothetical protein